MTKELHPTIARLASMNPVRPEDDLGRSPAAQATLRRILDSERHGAESRRRRLPRRSLAVALAVLVVGGGSAFAATDPFAWWTSQNPQTALYRTDLGHAVTPPTARVVNCQPGANGTFRCGTATTGRPYTLIDHVDGGANPFTRAGISLQISKALDSGRITAAVAQRIRNDLAQVSDSYLATLYDPRGAGQYGLTQPDNGTTFVPPPGVPAFLACRQNGQLLACQNLNGDEQVPAGTGIYMAQKTADWRPAPPTHRNPSLPARPAPTPAQARLLSDILTYLLTSTSSR